MRLQVLQESHSYLHKLGCQYGASANQRLLGCLGSHSKKKEQIVAGGLGQSGSVWLVSRIYHTSSYDLQLTKNKVILCVELIQRLFFV